MGGLHLQFELTEGARNGGNDFLASVIAEIILMNLSHEQKEFDNENGEQEMEGSYDK